MLGSARGAMKIELVRMLKRNNIARTLAQTWPNECKIMQHLKVLSPGQGQVKKKKRNSCPAVDSPGEFVFPFLNVLKTKS